MISNMENIVELPGICQVQTGEAYHSPAQMDARRNEKNRSLLWGGSGRAKIENRVFAYSAFLTTAQAILAGELEEPGAATA